MPKKAIVFSNIWGIVGGVKLKESLTQQRDLYCSEGNLGAVEKGIYLGYQESQLENWEQ